MMKSTRLVACSFPSDMRRRSSRTMSSICQYMNLQLMSLSNQIKHQDPMTSLEDYGIWTHSFQFIRLILYPCWVAVEGLSKFAGSGCGKCAQRVFRREVMGLLSLTSTLARNKSNSSLKPRKKGKVLGKGGRELENSIWCNGGTDGSRTHYLSACKADAFATLEPRSR